MGAPYSLGVIMGSAPFRAGVLKLDGCPSPACVRWGGASRPPPLLRALDWLFRCTSSGCLIMHTRNESKRFG